MSLLERDISRRVLLRTTIAGTLSATAAIWGVGVVDPAINNSSYPAALVDAGSNLNNLQLSVLITEHSRQAWMENRDYVTSTIDRFPVVIPEYFPYEFTGENGNPLTEFAAQKYHDDNYLFDEVDEYCKQQNKQVWVLDPSYSKEFMFYRAGLGWSECAVVVPIFLALANKLGLFSDDSDLRDYNHPLYTRRSLLMGLKNTVKITSSYLGGVLAVDVTGATADDDGSVGTALLGLETRLRHVIVAQSLHNLGDNLSEPTSALLIYPKAHWDQIKYYIENDSARQETLSRYKSLLSQMPCFDVFFKARNYTVQNDNWVKQSEFTI